MAGGFSEVSGKSYGITGENLELVSGDRRLGERPGLGVAQSVSGTCLSMDSLLDEPFSASLC